MSADKMLELQMQVRQNSDETKSYINDLNSWEKEIKEKEMNLINKSEKANKKLPPVRNKTIKNKVQKSKVKNDDSSKSIIENKKIKSWDYKAWDKFDVDKACEEIDNKFKDGDDADEDEEKIREEIIEKSNSLKEQGNEYFRQQKYNDAIECYTQALFIDPDNSVLYSNRAMCLIKQEMWTAAENDCSESLKIDAKNVKALLRRGTARIQLKKYEEARLDFLEVVRLEPSNKQARVELDRLNGCSNNSKTSGTNQTSIKVNSSSSSSSSSTNITVKGLVLPIDKPVSERSKKPLKRIKIEEIGIENLKITSSSPSAISVKSKLKDEENFEKFLKANGNDNDNENENLKSNEKCKNEMDDSVSKKVRKDCGDGKDIVNMESLSNNNLSDNIEKAVLIGNCLNEETKPIQQIENLTKDTNLKEIPKMVEEIESTETNAMTDTSLNVSAVTTTSTLSLSTTASSTSFSIQPQQAPPTSIVTTQPASPITASSTTTATQIPATSFQFQSDWKILKNKDLEFFNYFKNIQPSQYRHLFGEALESDMLHKIVCTLHMHYIRENMDCYKVLFYLTSVKRFSMIIMFLSNSDKALLRDIFQNISSSNVYTEDDIKHLKMMYEL